ncbi:MAG: AMP-binding protein [Planctomycetes bacterium]|nr:AMP-binding protein [Planctomycetota bacterium]
MTESSPWVFQLTIGEVLRQIAVQHPTRDAMVCLQAGIRQTWSEFDATVDSVALGLLGLGFQPGDHLGVLSTNWPEWVLLQFACARVGVVLVTVNPAYQVGELEYALAQSNMRGLALIDGYKQADFHRMLDELCPELATSFPGDLQSPRFPKLKCVIRMRGREHPGMVGWQQLLDAGSQVPTMEMADIEQRLTPTDPVNLQYTSGTTGRPKGALLTHRNLLLNGYYAAQRQRLMEQDRICIPVPLYHCFGCVLGTICAVVSGAAMIFPYEFFQAEATLNAIEKERCTAIYGVPTMFIAMLEHPTFPERDTSSLRTGIMAGSPCPIELMKRVTTVLGAREITIGFGQTEASPLITTTCTDDSLEHRVGTVGRPLPGIEVRIVDPQTHVELPDGESGELCCRGHNVMLGYYNQPELTAQSIDADGWLYTGDLAVRHADGYFRITGRFKDMIIRGGENIAPREIEELLYQHPKIEEVQVVGVPDRKYGEEVVAWIKLRAGESATDHEIRDYCRARIAHFKTPRYVKFVDSFPTTVTGKIQKFRIREQAIQDLGLQDAAAIETA